MIKKNKLIIILFLFLFIFSGCTSSKSSTDTSSIDGGVFKSADKGSTWQQRALIPTTTGSPKRFSSVSVNSMVIDPGDEKTVYFGSVGNGLIYTKDGGGSWEQVTGLGNTTIRSIAVDPQDKCTVLVAISNRVYKTTECTRSWKNTYYDNDSKNLINSIAIDHYDSKKVYIGNTNGDVIKSIDGGESWQTIKRFVGGIKGIFINPNDSRVIYVSTLKSGIYYSFDGGETWNEDLADKIKDLGLKKEIKDVVFVPDEANVLYIATEYGLARSDDKGDTWNKIDLIPSDKDATINAIAVNPRNADEIYFVTNTTFFRSLDQGKNWSTIKLPTTRAGWKILIDPQSPNIIYLGVQTITK